MKFVYNEEKNQKMRHILMMQPTIEEGEAALAKDETDPEAWYVYATALGLKKRYDESIEAYSHGIACAPFYAPNYFGRGRKYTATDRYWCAMADFTTCIQLDYSNWTYWYYRATAENLHNDLEESVYDFTQCMKYSAPEEHYPLVHLIYTTNVQLGKFDEAEAILNKIDATVKEPRMDYGYARSVRLYKGIVKPEEFIDIEGMKEVVLPRDHRVELELNGMLYGLYCYWTLHGDEQKAREAIEKLQTVAYKGAFGYTKSIPICKKLGIEVGVPYEG